MDEICVGILQVRNLGVNLPSFTSSHNQLETQLVPPCTTRKEEENEGDCDRGKEIIWDLGKGG